MGMMIDGRWATDDGAWAAKDGSFRRADTRFHCAIGDHGHRAEAGRYHLYVSLACPWAQRTLIMRRLKGLETLISVTVVHPHMLDQGWEFRPEPEPLYGATRLYELYARADAHYTGRVSVPVLWDKKTEAIVCNESAEIIRMFNTAFNTLTGDTNDYYPAALQKKSMRSMRLFMTTSTTASIAAALPLRKRLMKKPMMRCLPRWMRSKRGLRSMRFWSANG